jgi:hypothetical protein
VSRDKEIKLAARFFRFVALPREHKWLLMRAALSVATLRLILAVAPFRSVCDYVRRERKPLAAFSHVPVERLAWSVRVVARSVPGARCLTQALALQWILSRAGYAATLHIGVAMGGSRKLESHAWVEHGGRVIIGDDPALLRFVPILAS